MKNPYHRFKKWFFDGYEKELFQRESEKINAYNKPMLLFFDGVICLMFTILFVSSFFQDYVSALSWLYLGFLIFTVIDMIVFHCVLRRKTRWTEYGIWITMAKVYIFCILSGARYSQEQPAVSMYVFLIILSVLFIIPPIKLYLFNLGACIAFCTAVYAFKPAYLASADIFSCCMFYLFSILVGFWVTKSRINNIYKEKLLTMQRDRDIMTTLPNRRRFNEFAQEEFEKYKKGNLSILMMDIDHFKAYNDSKGHIAGDKCLETVGMTLDKYGEEHGVFFARYGGEEFVALDTQRNSQELPKLAKDIIRAVYDLNLPHETSKFQRLTMSIGYANQYDVMAEDYMNLLECADQALYEAKKDGRNRVSGYNKLC